MSNQRTTFLKRQREQNRKDKLRAKQERLAARRASPSGEKGPPIAWGESTQVDPSAEVPSDESPETTGDDAPTDES